MQISGSQRVGIQEGLATRVRQEGNLCWNYALPCLCSQKASFSNQWVWKMLTYLYDSIYELREPFFKSQNCLGKLYLVSKEPCLCIGSMEILLIWRFWGFLETFLAVSTVCESSWARDLIPVVAVTTPGSLSTSPQRNSWFAFWCTHCYFLCSRFMYLQLLCVMLTNSCLSSYSWRTED